MESLKSRWIDEARAIADRADREHRGLTPSESAKAHGLLERVRQITEAEEIRQLVDPVDAGPAYMDGAPAGDGLHGALMKGGFDRRSHPSVTVPAETALGLKAGSYTGTLGDGGVVGDVVSPGLGADNRFLFPRLRTEIIGADVTNVASYRQSSRTLPSPITDMIRTIDAVSPDKPETDTVSQLLAAPVKQIATISSGTPNVLLEHVPFRQWVSTDLQLAWRTAVDAHIVGEIASATTTTNTGGLNAYEDVIVAQSAVAAEGYNATLVVVSPADALAIQLLQMTSGDSYAFSQGPPALIVTPSVSDGAGFVIDPGAAGTLYISNPRFEVFEENAGATNSSTARFESNGVFVVQRPGAISLLAGGS